MNKQQFYIVRTIRFSILLLILIFFGSTMADAKAPPTTLEVKGILDCKVFPLGMTCKGGQQYCTMSAKTMKMECTTFINANKMFKFLSDKGFTNEI